MGLCGGWISPACGPISLRTCSHTKIGYEICFNGHFYKSVAPRPFAEVEASIRALETGIVQKLAEVTGSGTEPRE